MQKAFSQQNMIKCIPILWQELLKIKARVEDVTRTLDNKTVKLEKSNEFKKQLISNKGLREYFAQHPEEKEILINDIAKNDIANRNKIMYKHLSHLPFYVIPN
jgi:predicted AAA+ superfamily ATPase